MKGDYVNYVQTGPNLSGSIFQHGGLDTFNLAPPGWEMQPRAFVPEGYQQEDGFKSGQDSSNILEPWPTSVEDTSFSASCLRPAPLCRQFWKAGDYEVLHASKSRVQCNQNYLHVHPKFLHSNATSHKWAFGAIAELVDNAIDEIQNGATFVIVDKITDPRDGSLALLIQDDGGGMAPEAMRCCMSFGFSEKKFESAIGQYGNGFKTSTMRLGADVIVFSRHMDVTDWSKSTQSIGLLSYTYLSREGLDRIVVPMVDYKYNPSTASFEPLYHNGMDHFQLNLSTILQWSPYSTEADLLKQFDDVGYHGTKVIIYNLWFTNDGTLEFDFESDHEDICLQSPERSERTRSNKLSEEHFGNQFHFSLRVYLSILYLQLPQSFYIILRGKVVEHRSIVCDIIHPQLIKYKPHSGGSLEVVTAIGFLKEAPRVDINGFNVYHKNRLILPFWNVVNFKFKAKGVVGVLEANFIEPTHNKQDFERTSLFQKLETRLKEMTSEYWDCHCGLVGYNQVKKRTQARSVSLNKGSNLGPPVVNISAEAFLQNSRSSSVHHGIKRPQVEVPSAFGEEKSARRQVREFQFSTGKSSNQRDVLLMQENRKLRLKCSENENIEQELHWKVVRLSREIEEAENEYGSMLNELKELEFAKSENHVWI